NTTSLVKLMDYCLTFSSEVYHVWGMKWETTRVIFTLSRYLPFIGSALTCYGSFRPVLFAMWGFYLLSRRFDHSSSMLQPFSVIYIACVVFAEVILILRTYALWGRSRRVLAFLIALAVAFIIAATVLATHLNFSLPADSESSYIFYPSKCSYRTSRNSAFEYIFLVAYEIGTRAVFSYSFVHSAQVAIHGVLACRIFFNLKECDTHIRYGEYGPDLSLVTLRFRSHECGVTQQIEDTVP
ncbi:hypothetical protein BU15DRAFT_50055, partial [Melanogaster broomeanus]